MHIVVMGRAKPHLALAYHLMSLALTGAYVHATCIDLLGYDDTFFNPRPEGTNRNSCLERSSFVE
jgi:hypothetical protein